MNSLRKFNRPYLLEALLILVIAAVTYLPSLSQATIYRDDWYYTMDRLIGGPGTFQQMFSIDRPARGPFFETYYQLFGVNPAPYHALSFAWRVAGGLSALWFFSLIWPRQRKAVFTAALLFVLYPGYLRWMEGFEDQPRNMSAFLMALSFALTILALKTSKLPARIGAWTGAILTGWAYIALVDFAIGMEVFRLLCVFVFIQNTSPAAGLLQKGLNALRAWLPAALVGAGFLFWRLFIFHNERPATDIGLQLSGLGSSPVATALWWLVRLFQSMGNAAVTSWAAPLFENLFGMRLAGILATLFAAGACILLVVFFWRAAAVAEEEDFSPNMEMIWLGAAGVVFGVAPVVFANRYVSFGNYSHYALPASLASALLAAGLISAARTTRLRLLFTAVLVLMAVLTHASVADRILAEEKTISNFWHQVVWRAPGLKSGTTLLVNYPGISYNEDVDAVAGPANFLYYPQATNQLPAIYQIIAAPQMDYTTKDVIAGGDKPFGYRTHTGTMNYDNLLVITQPTESSCVHVLDPQWPRYTENDPDQILITGKYSKIANVITNAEPPTVPENIFGAEPAHGWCYYYQQAEAALQDKNWEKIAALGKEAEKLDLRPVDRVELLPFLQAYASLADEKAFKTAAVKVDTSPFARIQACSTLVNMQAAGIQFSPEIQAQMDEKLCRGKLKEHLPETNVPAP